jgi:hypothetical protein
LTRCIAFGFFHSWGPWESYTANLSLRTSQDVLTGEERLYDPPLPVSRLYEKRRCTKCGHEQHQQIRNF